MCFAVCSLNLTAYPFHPTGDCIGHHRDKINDWDSFPSSRCCLNGLNVFTEALALHASDNDAIFLSEEKWNQCDGPFSNQKTVSITKCGFKGLHYGSSECSSLSLSSFKQSYPKQHYFVHSNCSLFGPAFEDNCLACVDAIRDAREHILTDLKMRDNSTLRGICGTAVVIAAAAEHVGDLQWTGDFYRCLPASEAEDPVAKALLAVLVAVFSVLLVIILIKYVARKRLPKLVEGKEIYAWSGLYRFSKSEIESAMNFSSRKVSLGAGSAGRVYKGILPSGQVVGIKHIYKTNASDTFTSEVEGLSRIRHPNLVCLFGCCVENKEQYLVYEYCSNGNLAQNLLKRDSILSWVKRVKILRDCANALRFLHSYPDGCIVHRDIKAKDVIMGKRPLSDFEDPRLNGDLNVEDFESILHIAVLCVAKSSKGRPPIDVVLQELDKVWMNTEVIMKARNEHSSATPQSKSKSKSLEVMEV
ncbi:hypothetical protein IFM89_023657 [Coptis chinensis]|uniref:Protein kinase domain-containing protein n=1 Tax=Coptis chinensis TaxID=261450 RepID=A0A835LV73_9MAGN|nr:hypothetical protein IFM89_023657 [Coptis chinensis]